MLMLFINKVVIFYILKHNKTNNIIFWQEYINQQVQQHTAQNGQE